jgi:hypothetical protein
MTAYQWRRREGYFAGPKTTIVSVPFFDAAPATMAINVIQLDSRPED